MSNRSTLTEGSILVIGAAQGIGAAVARKLAATASCPRLILADIKREKTEAVAAQLSGCGAELVVREVDLGDAASVERLMAECGDVDRLALVASILHSHPTLDITPAMFEQVMRINMIGNFLAAQHLARNLIAQGRPGAICAVTSAGARRPQPDLAAYCASKAAVTSALRVLALATAEHDIRINFVAPTATQTGMMQGIDPAEVARTIPIPLGRVNQPEDIANSVAFLLSPESATMTMRELTVDGGSLKGL